jgi:hypothetical protein
MFYSVKARYIPSALTEFHRKLTDGTILRQRPEGREIVESMRRARLTEDGVVRWSEVCYCSTPLEHERRTVYDHYFTEIETEVVDGYIQFDGQPFMDFLTSMSSHD